MSKNYYQILEVSPGVTQKEIKKAYIKLALKYHPDRNRGNEERAKEKFQEIQEAYSALTSSQGGSDFRGNSNDINDILERLRRMMAQNEAELVENMRQSVEVVAQAFALHGVSPTDLDPNLWSGYRDWRDKLESLMDVDAPQKFSEFQEKLYSIVIDMGKQKTESQKKNPDQTENFSSAEQENLQKKQESLKSKNNNEQEIVDKVSESYSPSAADEFDKQHNQNIQDLKQDIEEAKKDLDKLDRGGNENDFYEKWTHEQLISEIKGIKEELKNNKNISSSGRQEKLEKLEKLEKAKSKVTDKSSNNDNSNDKLPTSLIIGGGAIVMVGLTALFIIRKISKKKSIKIRRD